jgi:hypothetical protein
MTRFLEFETSGQDFEELFLHMRHADIQRWSDMTSPEILGDLFFDIDAFVADPGLRSRVPDGIDESELRARVARAKGLLLKERGKAS